MSYARRRALMKGTLPYYFEWRPEDGIIEDFVIAIKGNASIVSEGEGLLLDGGTSPWAEAQVMFDDIITGFANCNIITTEIAYKEMSVSPSNYGMVRLSAVAPVRFQIVQWRGGSYIRYKGSSINNEINLGTVLPSAGTLKTVYDVVNNMGYVYLNGTLIKSQSLAGADVGTTTWLFAQGGGGTGGYGTVKITHIEVIGE